MTETLVAVLVLVVVVPLLWWSMWRGWQARARRQADIGPLPVPAPQVRAELVGPRSAGPSGVGGSYVSTTLAGRSLERVVARGLGTPSACRAHVGPPGVLLERQGAPDVWVPADRLTGVRVQRGQIGKAAGQLVVVITWEHGDVTLDTAVRPREADDVTRLHEAVAALTEEATP